MSQACVDVIQIKAALLPFYQATKLKVPPNALPPPTSVASLRSAPNLARREGASLPPASGAGAVPCAPQPRQLLRQHVLPPLAARAPNRKAARASPRSGRRPARHPRLLYEERPPPAGDRLPRTHRGSPPRRTGGQLNPSPPPRSRPSRRRAGPPCPTAAAAAGQARPPPRVTWPSACASACQAAAT